MYLRYGLAGGTPGDGDVGPPDRGVRRGVRPCSTVLLGSSPLMGRVLGPREGPGGCSQHSDAAARAYLGPLPPWEPFYLGEAVPE